MAKIDEKLLLANKADGCPLQKSINEKLCSIFCWQTRLMDAHCKKKIDRQLKSINEKFRSSAGKQV